MSDTMNTGVGSNDSTLSSNKENEEVKEQDKTPGESKQTQINQAAQTSAEQNQEQDKDDYFISNVLGDGTVAGGSNATPLNSVLADEKTLWGRDDVREVFMALANEDEEEAEKLFKANYKQMAVEYSQQNLDAANAYLTQKGGRGTAASEYLYGDTDKTTDEMSVDPNREYAGGGHWSGHTYVSGDETWREASLKRVKLKDGTIIDLGEDQTAAEWADEKNKNLKEGEEEIWGFHYNPDGEEGVTLAQDAYVKAWRKGEDTAGYNLTSYWDAIGITNPDESDWWGQAGVQEAFNSILDIGTFMSQMAQVPPAYLWGDVDLNKKDTEGYEAFQQTMGEGFMRLQSTKSWFDSWKFSKSDRALKDHWSGEGIAGTVGSVASQILIATGTGGGGAALRGGIGALAKGISKGQLGKASLLKFAKEIGTASKAAWGAKTSQITMAGMGSNGIMDEARASGVSSRMAATSTVALFGAMLGVQRVTGWVGDAVQHKILSKAVDKEVMASMDILRKAWDKGDDKAIGSWANRTAKKAFNTFSKMKEEAGVLGTAQGYISSAGSEAFEEVTESVTEEVVKQLSNLVIATGVTDSKASNDGKKLGRFKSFNDPNYWSDFGDNIVMSAFGGAIGGPVGKYIGKLHHTDNGNISPIFKDKLGQLVYEGKDSQFLEQLETYDKLGKFGSKEISTHWDEELGAYLTVKEAESRGFANAMSQSDYNKAALMNLYNYYKTTLDAIGVAGKGEQIELYRRMKAEQEDNGNSTVDGIYNKIMDSLDEKSNSALSRATQNIIKKRKGGTFRKTFTDEQIEAYDSVLKLLDDNKEALEKHGSKLFNDASNLVKEYIELDSQDTSPATIDDEKIQQIIDNKETADKQLNDPNAPQDIPTADEVTGGKVDKGLVAEKARIENELKAIIDGRKAEDMITNFYVDQLGLFKDLDEDIRLGIAKSLITSASDWALNKEQAAQDAREGTIAFNTKLNTVVSVNEKGDFIINDSEALSKLLQDGTTYLSTEQMIKINTALENATREFTNKAYTDANIKAAEALGKQVRTEGDLFLASLLSRRNLNNLNASKTEIHTQYDTNKVAEWFAANGEIEGGDSSVWYDAVDEWFEANKPEAHEDMPDPVDLGNALFNRSKSDASDDFHDALDALTQEERNSLADAMLKAEDIEPGFSTVPTVDILEENSPYFPQSLRNILQDYVNLRLDLNKKAKGVDNVNPDTLQGYMDFGFLEAGINITNGAINFGGNLIQEANDLYNIFQTTKIGDKNVFDDLNAVLEIKDAIKLQEDFAKLLLAVPEQLSILNDNQEQIFGEDVYKSMNANNLNRTKLLRFYNSYVHDLGAVSEIRQMLKDGQTLSDKQQKTFDAFIARIGRINELVKNLEDLKPKIKVMEDTARENLKKGGMEVARQQDFIDRMVGDLNLLTKLGEVTESEVSKQAHQLSIDMGKEANSTDPEDMVNNKKAVDALKVALFEELGNKSIDDRKSIYNSLITSAGLTKPDAMKLMALISHNYAEFQKSLATLIGDATEKGLPDSTQIEAIHSVQAFLNSDLGDIFGDKGSKHMMFAEGLQGTGKTTFIYRLGVEAANLEKSKKVFLVAPEQSQVDGLKSNKGELTISGDMLLEPFIKAINEDTKFLNGANTIVIDEATFLDGLTKDQGPLEKSSWEVFTTAVDKFNEGKGINDQIKVVMLGDNQQNGYTTEMRRPLETPIEFEQRKKSYAEGQVDNGSATLNSDLYRSYPLKYSHRSKVKQHIGHIESLLELTNVPMDDSEFKEAKSVWGKDEDGNLGGVQYGKQESDMDHVIKDIERRIAEDKDFDVAIIGFNADEVPKTLRELIDKHPDRFLERSHTKVQGAERTYAIINVKETDIGGKEAVKEDATKNKSLIDSHIKKLATSIGRAKNFAFVLNSTSKDLTSDEMSDPVTVMDSTLSDEVKTKMVDILQKTLEGVKTETPKNKEEVEQKKSSTVEEPPVVTPNKILEQVGLLETALSTIDPAEKGWKQLSKYAKYIKESVENGDFIGALNQLTSLNFNISKLPEGFPNKKLLEEYSSKVQNQIAVEGYEVTDNSDLTWDEDKGAVTKNGKEINAIATWVEDDSLKEGEVVVYRVRKPEIHKNGKLMQVVQVVFKAKPKDPSTTGKVQSQSSSFDMDKASKDTSWSNEVKINPGSIRLTVDGTNAILDILEGKEGVPMLLRLFKEDGKPTSVVIKSKSDLAQFKGMERNVYSVYDKDGNELYNVTNPDMADQVSGNVVEAEETAKFYDNIKTIASDSNMADKPYAELLRLVNDNSLSTDAREAAYYQLMVLDRDHGLTPAEYKAAQEAFNKIESVIDSSSEGDAAKVMRRIEEEAGDIVGYTNNTESTIEGGEAGLIGSISSLAGFNTISDPVKRAEFISDIVYGNIEPDIKIVMHKYSDESDADKSMSIIIIGTQDNKAVVLGTLPLNAITEENKAKLVDAGLAATGLAGQEWSRLTKGQSIVTDLKLSEEEKFEGQTILGLIGGNSRTASKGKLDVSETESFSFNEAKENFENQGLNVGAIPVILTTKKHKGKVAMVYSWDQSIDMSKEGVIKLMNDLKDPHFGEEFVGADKIGFIMLDPGHYKLTDLAQQLGVEGVDVNWDKVRAKSMDMLYGQYTKQLARFLVSASALTSAVNSNEQYPGSPLDMLYNDGDNKYFPNTVQLGLTDMKKAIDSLTGAEKEAWDEMATFMASIGDVATDVETGDVLTEDTEGGGQRVDIDRSKYSPMLYLPPSLLEALAIKYSGGDASLVASLGIDFHDNTAEKVYLDRLLKLAAHISGKFNVDALAIIDKIMEAEGGIFRNGVKMRPKLAAVKGNLSPIGTMVENGNINLSTSVQSIGEPQPFFNVEGVVEILKDPDAAYINDDTTDHTVVETPPTEDPKSPESDIAEINELNELLSQLDQGVDQAALESQVFALYNSIGDRDIAEQAKQIISDSDMLNTPPQWVGTPSPNQANRYEIGDTTNTVSQDQLTDVFKNNLNDTIISALLDGSDIDTLSIITNVRSKGPYTKPIVDVAVITREQAEELVGLETDKREALATISRVSEFKNKRNVSEEDATQLIRDLEKMEPLVPSWLYQRLLNNAKDVFHVARQASLIKEDIERSGIMEGKPLTLSGLFREVGFNIDVVTGKAFSSPENNVSLINNELMKLNEYINKVRSVLGVSQPEVMASLENFAIRFETMLNELASSGQKGVNVSTPIGPGNWAPTINGASLDAGLVDTIGVILGQDPMALQQWKNFLENAPTWDADYAAVSTKLLESLSLQGMQGDALVGLMDYFDAVTEFNENQNENCK